MPLKFRPICWDWCRRDKDWSEKFYFSHLRINVASSDGLTKGEAWYKK